ncbi:MAG TPA: cysteine desulfurase family protein, partial [Geobacteraceae bacterium]
MIYLDHNATTPVLPEVIEALLPFYRDKFGNPSSIHWAGRAVKEAVEEARERVALLVNCDPAEVLFTSCGTEANNTALKGIASALRDRGNHIITTRVEHPAVTNPCQFLEHAGYRVTWLEVNEYGLPDLDALEAAIGPDTILITIMAANNETGVIMPLAEIGAIARRHRVYLHSDAVQAAGKLPLDCRSLDLQLLSVSGHKLYAPKGVGALVIRKGVKLHPLLHGGAQERNRRAGTENVAGIVAFGTACELARISLVEESRRLLRLRRRLEEGITAAVPGVVLVGAAVPRLPNTATFCFPGVAADSLLFNLDLEGIACSSGSACSSGTLKSSPVLTAMGFSPELARGTIRFSLGRGNTETEIDRVTELLPTIVARL